MSSQEISVSEGKVGDLATVVRAPRKRQPKVVQHRIAIDRRTGTATIVEEYEPATQAAPAIQAPAAAAPAPARRRAPAAKVVPAAIPAPDVEYFTVNIKTPHVTRRSHPASPNAALALKRSEELRKAGTPRGAALKQAWDEIKSRQAGTAAAGK